MKNFNFKKKQLLVEYDADPIKEGTDANDILIVKIIDRGDEVVDYKEDKEVLVRRGYLEPIKSPLFKKNQFIIFEESKVLCSYQK